MPQATLTTRRLILRPPRIEDAEAVYNGYASDPEVTRFVLFAPHRSIAESEAFLASFIEASQGSEQYSWMVVRAGEERVLGGMHLRVVPPSSEVGFALARADWGSGYATEMVQAVVDLALGLPDVYRIQALCHVAHAASARVLEKAGMLQEGVLERYLMFPNLGPEPQSAYMYAKTR